MICGLCAGEHHSAACPLARETLLAAELEPDLAMLDEANRRDAEIERITRDP